MRGLLRIALLVVLVGGVVSADEPVSSAEFRKLGDILDQLGYEPKPWLEQFYQITLERDQWAVQILLSLNSDHSKLWLECRFPRIESPESVPGELWQSLLAANEKIAPAHFVFRKDDSRIHLYQQLPIEPLDPAGLRKSIESFDATVRKTAPLWADERFHSRSTLPLPRELESLPAPQEFVELLPLPREFKHDPTQEAIDRLQGQWEIIRIEYRGQKMDHSVIESMNPTLEFRDCVATLRTGTTEKRMIAQIDPLRPTKQIDFVDSSQRIEKGLFHLDQEHLTICFASAGESRPDQFSTSSDKNHWLLLLKRKK